MDHDKEKSSDKEEFAEKVDELQGTVKKLYSFAKYLELINRHPGKGWDAVLLTISGLCGTVIKWLISHANGDIKYFIVAAVFSLLCVICFCWVVIRLSRRARTQVSDLPQALKGLNPYSDSDKDGETFAHLNRDEELNESLRLLEENKRPVLAIWGISGAGKTSFLRAGIQFNLKHPAKPSGTKQSVPCLYWSAGEGRTATNLAQSIEKIAGIHCNSSLATALAKCKERLVIIIDEFEQLQRTNPGNAPIFDFIHQLATNPAAHALQLVISIDLLSVPAWLDFTQANHLNIPKIIIGSLRLEKAILSCQYLLNAAKVKVHPIVLRHYLTYASDAGAVSPIDIAIATVSFAQTQASRAMGMKEYVLAGGPVGVLSAYVNKRLDSPYVPVQDHDSIVRGITNTLINVENDLVVEEGAPLDKIAAVGNLPILRMQESLNTLVAGRILEKPFSNIYRLAHKRLIRVFKDLAHTSTSREVSLVIQYHQWLLEKRRHLLLRGSDLDWILTNINGFLSAPDSSSRREYIKASMWMRKVRYAGALIVLVALGVSTVKLWNILEVHKYKAQLEASKLPVDLYERQEKLELLDINSEALKTIDWLHSSTLKTISLKSSALRSLKGLANLRNLRSVEIDLDKMPSDSLEQLMLLPNLQTLTVHHIARAHTASPFKFPQSVTLTTLDLDLSGQLMFSLPPYPSFPSLTKVALNLTSDTAVSELPVLDNAPLLTTVKIMLDHSGIKTLKPIAALTNLTDLDLSLDSSQMQMLAQLGESPLKSLTLHIDSHPPAVLPDLSDLHALSSLTIISDGSKINLDNIKRLKHLQYLSLETMFSPSLVLPKLTELTELKSLILNLQGSTIHALPDIGSLGSLETLKLNINSTQITALPKFDGLPNLTNVDLAFRFTKIKSLSELEHSNGIQILTLDVSSRELFEILKSPLGSVLHKLAVNLFWNQAHDISKLPVIPELRALQLNIAGNWDMESIPDLKSFTQVEELELSLEGKNIRLSDLGVMKKLKKISLNLRQADVQNISDVVATNSVAEVVVNASGPNLNTLAGLNGLNKLRGVILDISHSEIKDLHALEKILNLEELKLDDECTSLVGMPSTVRRIHFVR